MNIMYINLKNWSKNIPCNLRINILLISDRIIFSLHYKVYHLSKYSDLDSESVMSMYND